MPSTGQKRSSDDWVYFTLPSLSALSFLVVVAFVLILKIKRSAAEGSTSTGGDFSLPSASFASEEIQRDQSQSHCRHTMEDEPEHTAETATAALSHASDLIPTALEKARSTMGYAIRWRSIISKLEQLPPTLSELSSHPFFTKNALCREQLYSIAATLTDAINLADRCCSREPQPVGKLQMQSDLDALAGKLDLNLRDCTLLIKTGVLGDGATFPSAIARSSETDPARIRVRELLARLQIGHAEAKHRAVDGLLEAMKDDEKSVLSVLNRTSISALVQLLATATPTKTREKAAAFICLLAEAASVVFEQHLIAEGALPALIRLAESGSAVARKKSVLSLQYLSASPDTARAIVGHGGARPLIETCCSGDSVSQSAAAGVLKNLAAVPEARQVLYEEGIVKATIDLLNRGMMLGTKEYAAECLYHLTSSNESLRRSVATEGGVRSLLAYLDGPSPQEPAVATIRNLVGAIPIENLISLNLLPRLVHVLEHGSPLAQQAAAATVTKISCSVEVKRLVGEAGCVPLLVRLLGAKSGRAREAAAQALASLMSWQENCREVKRVEGSVGSLVSLLEPGMEGAAKKYAVACLAVMSTSKRCRKMMVAYGAVGSLRKLAEMEVVGARKLVERLERGKLRSLFSRKLVV